MLRIVEGEVHPQRQIYHLTGPGGVVAFARLSSRRAMITAYAGRSDPEADVVVVKLEILNCRLHTHVWGVHLGSGNTLPL